MMSDDVLESEGTPFKNSAVPMQDESFRARLVTPQILERQGGSYTQLPLKKVRRAFLARSCENASILTAMKMIS